MSISVLSVWHSFCNVARSLCSVAIMSSLTSMVSKVIEHCSSSSAILYAIIREDLISDSMAFSFCNISASIRRLPTCSLSESLSFLESMASCLYALKASVTLISCSSRFWLSCWSFFSSSSSSSLSWQSCRTCLA